MASTTAMAAFSSTVMGRSEYVRGSNTQDRCPGRTVKRGSGYSSVVMLRPVGRALTASS